MFIPVPSTTLQSRTKSPWQAWRGRQYLYEPRIVPTEGSKGCWTSDHFRLNDIRSLFHFKLYKASVPPRSNNGALVGMRNTGVSQRFRLDMDSLWRQTRCRFTLTYHPMSHMTTSLSIGYNHRRDFFFLLLRHTTSNLSIGWSNRRNFFFLLLSFYSTLRTIVCGKVLSILHLRAWFTRSIETHTFLYRSKRLRRYFLAPEAL